MFNPLCRYTSGADANRADADGATPLHAAAAAAGNEDVLRTLLAAPGAADVVNAASKETGTTPLLISAQEGNQEAMRQLIQAGADVNKPDDDGDAPLYVAAQEGHASDILKVLLEAPGWGPARVVDQIG